MLFDSIINIFLEKNQKKLYNYVEVRSMDKRYCSHCGKEVNPEAVVCVGCGCSLRSDSHVQGESSDGMRIAIQIFMILGIISSCWLLIPLIWTIPMYLKTMKYLRGEAQMSTGYKVCVLLFDNLIAGILLLIVENK